VRNSSLLNKVTANEHHRRRKLNQQFFINEGEAPSGEIKNQPAAASKIGGTVKFCA
jgi:hypothetical protein